MDFFDQGPRLCRETFDSIRGDMTLFDAFSYYGVEIENLNMAS